MIAAEHDRCGVCGWPLAAESQLGCHRGQCSMHMIPPRAKWHDAERYDRERAERQGVSQLTDIDANVENEKEIVQ